MLVTVAGCTPGKGALDCGKRASADLNPPEKLRPFKLDFVDPDESELANGHLLVNQFNKKTESFAAAIDGCAAHVWWEKAQSQATKITRTRMGRDGRSVIFSEYDRFRLADTGEIRRHDLKTGELTVTPAEEQHHDFVEMPDGQLAWLSWQYIANDWFPSLDTDIATDAIRVADEGSDGEHEILFSVPEDSGVEMFWACRHMAPDTFVPGYAEWSHANSLMYDEDQDALFVLVRYWDALLRIERDGTLGWILGGTNNEFTVADGTELPKHGHMSEFWPGGMLVFDNRSHSGGKASRVVEYAIDEEARTVEEVWSYEEPNGQFWSYLGDARRLPGGNVVIAWSGSGQITEVNRAGEVVWSAETDHELGRLEFVEDWPWVQ